MAYLNTEEKEELLRLARSKNLKKDMRKLRENSRNILRTPDYINKYIEFLTLINKFFGHKRKRFRKMEGNKFVL